MVFADKSVKILDLFSILALVFAASTSTAQSISVGTVPPYRTLGFITGTVTGVDPNTHHVAVYIHDHQHGGKCRTDLRGTPLPPPCADLFGVATRVLESPFD